VTQLDFTIEFNSDLEDKNLERRLFDEADARLRDLAKGHTDVIGAAVTIRQLAAAETAAMHEATVVAYSRPKRIVGKEKQESAVGALKGALEAVERQVREKRETLRERWEQPQKDPVTQEVIDVVAAEESEEIVEDTVDEQNDERA
jgi:ribosome-associated translation inhibitor RaiA